MNYSEKYRKLLDEIIKNGDSIDKEIIAELPDTYYRYVHLVAREEDRIKVARFTHQGDSEAFQDVVKNLDETRVATHNSCVTSTNMLNRYYNMYFGEEFYHTETEESERKSSNLDYRLEIGKFAHSFVTEHNDYAFSKYGKHFSSEYDTPSKDAKEIIENFDLSNLDYNEKDNLNYGK